MCDNPSDTEWQINISTLSEDCGTLIQIANTAIFAISSCQKILNFAMQISPAIGPRHIPLSELNNDKIL